MGCLRPHWLRGFTPWLSVPSPHLQAVRERLSRSVVRFSFGQLVAELDASEVRAAACVASCRNSSIYRRTPRLAHAAESFLLSMPMPCAILCTLFLRVVVTVVACARMW